MLNKHDYVSYLLSAQTNYTCTELTDHKANLSHDAVSDFLRRERFTPSQLWKTVRSHIEDSSQAAMIIGDSVQSRKYSRFIELVKCQYSGNEHSTVRGIGLVNLVHSSGNDGDFWPIDYRVYHPETDGKTKNDHFREMFTRLTTHKNIQARTILFNGWYGSADNLKCIHRSGWTFFTTLKSNRKVSINRDIGYQNLDELHFDETTLHTGLFVKLHKLPFKVKLFKTVRRAIVTTDGRIEWIVTNDLDQHVNCFVAELKNDNRWQVEDFHRGCKQLTGSEQCLCRKARSQRNHLACCYHAWVSLKVQAKKLKTTIYQVKHSQLTDYLLNQLYYPTIPAL